MEQYNDEAGTAIAIVLDPSLAVIAIRTLYVFMSNYHYRHLLANLGEVVH